MAPPRPGDTVTRVARGGAFVALVLGLVLFANVSQGFLGEGFWWTVAVHIAVGLIAIGAGFVVVASARRAPASGTGRIRTLVVVAAAFLALLIVTGAALLAGNLAGNVLESGRYAHLALGFLTVVALVALGLTVRRATRAT